MRETTYRKTETQKYRITEKQIDRQNICMALTGLEMSETSRKHVKSGGRNELFIVYLKNLFLIFTIER